MKKINEELLEQLLYDEDYFYIDDEMEGYDGEGLD